MKTRDKIVSVALKLFNKNGERKMTTNHIATALKISPGNLYYHFTNKEEIIRDIFAEYSVELLAGFAPVDEQQDNFEQLKHYLDCVFSLMWKYRFFYANLPQILQRDKILHEQYLDVQKRSISNLNTIFKTFVELEYLNIKQDEVQPLVNTLHLINFSWLSYQSSMSLTTDITRKAIYEGMLQITNVMKPYTTPLGEKQLNLLEEGIKASSKK